jgi:protein required for attachment to host cells
MMGRMRRQMTNTLTDRTLVLAADGRQARFFVEERRGAGLREQTDWAMSLSAEDRYDPQDRPARAFDRVGPGRHGMEGDRDLHDREEINFLTRLAERLNAAHKAGAFDALAVFAPPAALGRLRAMMAGDVRQRVTQEEGKDVVRETPAQIAQRLADLRMP